MRRAALFDSLTRRRRGDLTAYAGTTCAGRRRGHMDHGRRSRDAGVIASDLIEQTRLAARALAEFGGGLFNPTVRLGITGLSRAGKTVFITALVHGLVRGGRFPVFEAAGGAGASPARAWRRSPTMRCRASTTRTTRGADRGPAMAAIDAPDQRIARGHRLSVAERRDAHSSPSISSTIRANGCWTCRCWTRATSNGRRRALRSRARACGQRSRPTGTRIWRRSIRWRRPRKSQAIEAARLFTAYLQACRDERTAMSLLPPGRFLMPGDMAGSPALTFAPLDLPANGDEPPRGSLWAMMRRRYDAYRDHVVRPFFREHFARLDRQIVLVDALSAFNAGPEAVHDLQAALVSILDCFSIGRASLFSSAVPAAHRPDPVRRHQGRPSAPPGPRPARSDPQAHDRARHRAGRFRRRRGGRDRARRRARHARGAWCGARAARCRPSSALARQGRERGRPDARRRDRDRVVSGRPARRSGIASSGRTERHSAASPHGPAQDTDFRFVRFRPPALERTEDGVPALPHIRLDRALQFLIGDRLR